MAKVIDSTKTGAGGIAQSIVFDADWDTSGHLKSSPGSAVTVDLTVPAGITQSTIGANYVALCDGSQAHTLNILNENAFSGATGITVVAEVNLATTNFGKPIRQWGSSGIFIFEIDAAGAITAGCVDATDSNALIRKTANGVISAGSTYVIAWRLSGSTLELAVNGSLVALPNDVWVMGASLSSFRSEANLWVATEAYGAEGQLNGKLGVCRVQKVAVTQSQLISLSTDPYQVYEGAGGGGTDATAPGATVTGTGTVAAGTASGGGAATGTFTFDSCENNTHSGILNNVAVNWTWLGGTVGSITSITNGSGTMTTAGMTISGLPTGAGCGIIRSADGTVVAYQEGTVA